LHRPVRQQDDVCGFDVAVDDTLAMRIVERVQDLRHDPHDVGNLDTLVRLEALLELTTLDELHRDIPDAAVLAKIVDGYDVGMIEPARRLRLPPEAGDHGRRISAGKLVRADGLERNDALDRWIVALVDHAHCTAPDFAPNLVFADAIDLCHGSLAHSVPENGDAGGGPASQTSRPALNRSLVLAVDVPHRFLHEALDHGVKCHATLLRLVH